MIPIVRLIALAAAVALAGGCYFDKPLTGGPSSDLNTWLLGVWEHKSAEGLTSTVRVIPVSDDRFTVQATIAGKTPKAAKVYVFAGWISRVGDSNFLTLRCEQSPGDIPSGGFVFVQGQLLDQNHIRLRGLQIDLPATSTSMELRKEVRRKLKERSLYDEEKATDWTRIEEVIWTKDGSDPAFKPLRNPTL